jgi:hypothetical protein
MSAGNALRSASNKRMLAALAVNNGLGSRRWLTGEPYVFPVAFIAAPIGFAAVQLSGAFGNSTQAVDASLNGHLAATFDGVDLLAERVKTSALARIGKQP